MTDPLEIRLLKYRDMEIWCRCRDASTSREVVYTLMVREIDRWADNWSRYLRDCPEKAPRVLYVGLPGAGWSEIPLGGGQAAVLLASHAVLKDLIERHLSSRSADPETAKVDDVLWNWQG